MLVFYISKKYNLAFIINISLINYNLIFINNISLINYKLTFLINIFNKQ